MMLSQHCLNFSSFWEQVLNSCAYSSDLSSVAYMLEKEYACCGGISKMDIGLLEEQYNCSKQQQKLQTHVIVFRAVDFESFSGEALVSAILVNGEERQPTAFQEHTSDDGITLDMLFKTSLQDHNAPWRVHLGVHRAQQYQNVCSKDEVMDRNEQTKLENEVLTSTPAAVLPREQLLNSEPAVKVTYEHGDAGALHDVTGSSTDSLSSAQMKASLDCIAPTICTSQQDPRLLTVSHKCHHYPFPQKKTPRKSEAARRLGLYTSQ